MRAKPIVCGILLRQSIPLGVQQVGDLDSLSASKNFLVSQNLDLRPMVLRARTQEDC